MKFSIVVPIYNVEEYLDACIKSVIAQNYTNFELLLIDDGSTDKSSEICDSWEKEDERIRVIHRRNGGSAATRNEGIQAASGEYLLFLDSDDYWLSTDVLQEIANRIESTKPDVLILNYQKDFSGNLSAPYFSEALSVPADLNAEDVETFVFGNDLWTACAWNKVTKATLYDEGKLRFCEGITSEDVDWCYRLALAADGFDFLNKNVVGYRQRSNSITGSSSVRKVKCLLNNINTCVALSAAAEPAKKQNLSAYLSYQYGTLLHGFSVLPASAEKDSLFVPIKKLEYLLAYSQNAKIKLIRGIKNLLGLKITLRFLALRAYLETRRNRRSN